jgi:hypothetical protein
VELAGDHLPLDDELEGHRPVGQVGVERLEVEKDGLVGRRDRRAVLGVGEPQQPEGERAAVGPVVLVGGRLDPVHPVGPPVVEQRGEGEFGDLAPGPRRIVGAHPAGEAGQVVDDPAGAHRALDRGLVGHHEVDRPQRELAEIVAVVVEIGARGRPLQQVKHRRHQLERAPASLDVITHAVIEHRGCDRFAEPCAVPL